MTLCLIVDDSDIIRRIAAHFLADYGFKTVEAENGEVALDRCAEAMPDLILLDWHMPAMGGMEFLSVLRGKPRGDQPHIIYCTTENDVTDLARALSAGANDYLIKPFDRDGFRAKIDGLLAPA